MRKKPLGHRRGEHPARAKNLHYLAEHASGCRLADRS
jgi:hypothetical protein